jgi:hypothetical protein
MLLLTAVWLGAILVVPCAVARRLTPAPRGAGITGPAAAVFRLGVLAATGGDADAGRQVPH